MTIQCGADAGKSDNEGEGNMIMSFQSKRLRAAPFGGEVLKGDGEVIKNASAQGSVCSQEPTSLL